MASGILEEPLYVPEIQFSILSIQDIIQYRPKKNRCLLLHLLIFVRTLDKNQFPYF